MAEPVLITSIVGIVVSGILGPQLTAWATRRADRKRFEREQAAKRRDDLRQLVDEAAQLLAPGATNLRLLREADIAKAPADPDVSDWPRRVYVLGQRLRLRLPLEAAVVQHYEEVRIKLVAAAEARGEDSDEEALVEFEAARARLLDTARDALARPIADPSWRQLKRTSSRP